MIKKIILENFQSHEKTEIELDKINIVSGDSNAGKTAVIRAISWILGRTKGDYFVRKKSKKSHTSVTIITEDYEIKKVRTNSEQHYILKKLSDGTQQKFERMGLVCPVEIQEALNIKDINLQEQHDVIFLVQDTTTERASLLNKYLDYETLDQITDLCITTTNTLMNTTRDLESNLLTHINDIKKYESVVIKTRPILEKIKEIYNEYTSNISIRDEITKIRSDILEKEQERNSKKEKLDSIPDLRSIYDVVISLEEKYKDLDSIKSSILSIRNNSNLLNRLKDRYSKLPKDISNSIEEYEKIITKKNTIQSGINSIRNSLQTTFELKSRLENIDFEIDTLKREALESNLLCSECGRPINEDVLHSL